MNAPEWDKKTIMSKAAHFAVGSGIEGDYYEFGVFEGRSLSSAFWAFKWAYHSLLENYGFLLEPWNRDRIAREWEAMIFHGFDSFEGLPAANETDGPFRKGDYACAEDRVKDFLASNGVESSKVRLRKGWFKDIAPADLASARKASVIHIDCDLYASTVDALQVCTPLLQDGTVIIFDDWFQYRGSPFKGEQRAFREWSGQLADRFQFSEYHREDVWRNSFIASSTSTPRQ